jgi:hypothetical protein
LNILIDTAALASPSDMAEGRYWATHLPQLLSRIGEHNVFLLRRPGCQLNLPNASLRVLDAPTYNTEHSVVEDRQLAALCKELQIDVFLSTLYTTAGGKVPSVMVAISTTGPSRANRLAWPRLQNARTDEIIAALVQAASSQPDDETCRNRSAEENALQAEAERLRKRSLDQAEELWRRAMAPVSPSRRVLRALKSVHRYPEYFRRLCRMNPEERSG